MQDQARANPPYKFVKRHRAYKTPRTLRNAVWLVMIMSLVYFMFSLGLWLSVGG